MVREMWFEVLMIVVAFLIGLLGRHSRIKILEDMVVDLKQRNDKAWTIICKRDKEVDDWRHKSIQLEDELLDVRRENSRLKDELLKYKF